VAAPASADELGKRLLKEAEEGRLLAADIHDNPRDQEWILHDWMPRAFKAGLKAAASKRPSGYFGRLSTTSIQAQAEELRHQAFDDIASARDWLIRCEVA
jgi:hypothetical protein